MVDISLYEEQIYFFQEDTCIHKFTYIRKANGYVTTERGSVFLTPSGNVQFLAFQSTGKFDNVVVPQIDGEKLDKKLDVAIKDKFGETIVEYAVKDKVLDFNDGILIVNCSFEFITEEGYAIREMIEIPIE